MDMNLTEIKHLFCIVRLHEQLTLTFYPVQAYDSYFIQTPDYMSDLLFDKLLPETTLRKRSKR